MLSVALVFVTARLHLAAVGDTSRFIVAGQNFVDGAGTPEPVHIYPGDGYDGQFLYRLAVDPTTLTVDEHLGVRLDNVLRLQRIVYPVLAWLLSGGKSSNVQVSLIAVNVLGLAVTGWLAGVWARRCDRHACWGLFVVGYWGFFFTLGRNLTEVTVAMFLVLATSAVLSRQHALAAVSLSLAVLTRESAVWFVAGLAAPHLYTSTRDSLAGRKVVADKMLAVFVIPLCAFVSWQSFCFASTGALPIRSGGSMNMRLPFADLLPAMLVWIAGLTGPNWRYSLVVILQALTLTLVVGFAARALPRSTVPASLKGAWAASLLLVASLSDSVWVGPADFRTAVELYVASALILLTERRSLLVPAIAVIPATAVTVVMRTLII